MIGAWPTNMQYLSCDDYDGTNTPDRNIDLKSYFVNVKEPTTYGNFSFPARTNNNNQFNGHSFMKFDMEISAVSVRGGASVNTKTLGTWTSGLTSPINIVNAEDTKNLTADVVYRVYTVVVSEKTFVAVHSHLVAENIYRTRFMFIRNTAIAVHHARSGCTEKVQRLLHRFVE